MNSKNIMMMAGLCAMASSASIHHHDMRAPGVKKEKEKPQQSEEEKQAALAKAQAKRDRKAKAKL